MAISVLFEQFNNFQSSLALNFFFFNFLILILSASPNMMHFVRTFLNMRVQG